MRAGRGGREGSHRGVVHGILRHWEHGRDGEYDGDEERPADTVHVHSPTEQAFAHVKRARLEVHIWVMLVHTSSAATDIPFSQTIVRREIYRGGGRTRR